MRRGRTSQIGWISAVSLALAGSAQPAPGQVAHRVAEATRAAAQVVPPGASTGLAAVLAATLPHWAEGGRIEKARLETLAADHRIKGAQAAALVTLLRHFGKGVPHQLPITEFTTQIGDRKLDQSYQKLIERLGEIPDALFVEGAPHLDRLKQGPAGDCYLFSGAGWMARHRPRRLIEMIQPLPQHRFEVRFPSGEHAIVAAPTDTEILYNETSSTLGDGLWMAVLEKAVGTIEGRTNRSKAAIADPSLRVNLGGSAKNDVHRWTGHAVDAFALQDSRQAHQAHAALVEMDRRHLMAQAVSAVLEPHGPLPMNHAFAVLGFNPATQELTVWNPWGDEFTPQGSPGLVHGWPRHHGVFTIPFHDFTRVFAWLDVEHP